MSAVATAVPSATRAGAPRSTHFRFEHKVFGVEGARFALTSDSQEAALYVLLGDLQVALLLPTLRYEFGIKPDSNDGDLLSVVERSLRYVKEIRPNDSIPREILDGSASWQVEDRHRMIAKGRLSLQIASWLTGDEHVVVDLVALEQLVEDPLTKQKVDQAFGEIAEKLGIGRERKNEVVDRIDDLARELAYIEALRERYGCVQEVIRKLGEFVRTYKNDRTMTQEISRVRTLLMRPQSEFDSLFGQCDAMTGEILSVLKKFEAQVEFVRDMRDDLHSKLMKWDDVITQWKGLDVVKGENQENAIKAMYRFTARNYPQRQDWRA
ncbi:MAG TPA: hypothetical protein VN823_02800 [Stellaceae bacterium]|nr:hypothetical protein [Stellaceae bacterium]